MIFLVAGAAITALCADLAGLAAALVLMAVTIEIAAWGRSLP